MVLEKLAGISRENQKMQRTTAEAGTRVLYRDEGGDRGRCQDRMTTDTGKRHRLQLDR